MRTTVNINDAILRELRERARLEERPFRDVLEHTLQVGLARLDTPAPSTPFRVKAHALGIKPGFRGMSMNQLYDQIEAEDTARGA
ncbi:MAG: hypothetical protein OXQ31_04435 [Spirochaetaceae bacterium]|nr:hypothetical protein [Spirochaetaceae bacterium]